MSTDTANGRAGTVEATFTALLARGFWPVAVYPPDYVDQNGRNRGKSPIGKGWGLERWDLERWQRATRRQPRPGIGVCLGPGRGPDGTWLIDVEGDGPEYGDSLQSLLAGEQVESLGWTSRRGGHLLLTVDTGRMRAIHDALAAAGFEKKGAAGAGAFKVPGLPDLEFRLGGWKGDGTIKQTQSVCPPSPDADGTPRRWNGPETVAPAPEAFYATLERLASPTAPEGNGRGHKSTSGGLWVRSVESSQRAWFLKALERETGQAAMAREGERHNRLRAAGNTLFGHMHHGHLDDAEITAELTEAGRRCGLPDAEVRETIDACREWGTAHPLDWPDRLERPGANGHASNGKPHAEPRAEPEPDPAQFLREDWPAPPDPIVYRGRLGELVRLIEPATEADPLAILGQLLVAYGNLIGRGPHVLVEETPHYANENVVVVGETSAGRKGTSWRWCRRALEEIDPVWLKERVAGGLSSGEGLIHEIRDPVEKPDEDGNMQVVDEGVADKRLLCVESEFGSMLRILARQGNSLSGIVRQAWDSDPMLRTMTKTSPSRASNPHVSLIGHITAPELRTYLEEVEVFNGLGNRFLWLCVRRARVLPRGGRLSLDDLRSFKSLGRSLYLEAASARGVGEVHWTSDADALWEDHYERLTSGRPGLWGATTARAAPHALRLALIYALADGVSTLDYEHLHAGLALVDYADRSAAHLFGDRLGDRTADAILDALRTHPEGLSRTELRDLFHRNKSAEQIARALAVLLKYGLASRERRETTGRPVEVWFAAGKTGVRPNDKTDQRGG
jgi:hypothetical protein